MTPKSVARTLKKYDLSLDEIARFRQLDVLVLSAAGETPSPPLPRGAAASISGLLLTTDCAITEIKEKKDKSPAGGGGMDDFDY